MKDSLHITREQLDEIADCASMDTDQIRTDYSGRGMYGTGCIGVVGSAGDGIAFLIGFLDTKLSGVMDPRGEDEERDDSFSFAYKLAQSTRTDSMGKDIITYWPDLMLEAGDEE